MTGRSALTGRRSRLAARIRLRAGRSGKMPHVRGNHHPSPGHFIANELGRDVLANGDARHLERDQRLTGSFQLCHINLSR